MQAQDLLYLVEMTIGNRMKAARLQAGKTQQAIADAISVTVANVSHYETDRSNPSLAAAIAFCRETGVSLDWIVLGREPSAGYDKRIRELPAALREYVVEALLLAERVQLSAPAKFLQPPTTETYIEFSEMLSKLSEELRKAKV
jgi:transcriptional regulator with XRE-family HTH domain